MSWGNRSRRRAELPSDWPKIRENILNRDGYTCQIRGPGCTILATDVDHGDAGRHIHTPDNLRAACGPCHRQRTAAQGNAAKPPRTRPTARHPGLL